jgi:hypothetical protein
MCCCGGLGVKIPDESGEELAGPNISALKGQCSGQLTQAYQGNNTPILQKRKHFRKFKLELG